MTPFRTLACALALLPFAAFAQETEGEPPPEQSAILPSAEDHVESEAPTMDIDCENSPEECEDPLTDAVVGPTLSEPDDPATADVEAEAGEPVVSAPD